MFQKEVAERILADVNSKDYSRITILSKWKFDIRKITDVKPNSFFPKPKINSSVLEFVPKTKIHEIRDPKNLEKITKVFFSQRRKMINKPINILFKKLQFDLRNDKITCHFQIEVYCIITSSKQPVLGKHQGPRFSANSSA